MKSNMKCLLFDWFSPSYYLGFDPILDRLDTGIYSYVGLLCLGNVVESTAESETKAKDVICVEYRISAKAQRIDDLAVSVVASINSTGDLLQGGLYMFFQSRGGRDLYFTSLFQYRILQVVKR